MHAQSRAGENLEITSKGYLSLFKLGTEGAKVFYDDYATPQEFILPDKKGIYHIHDKDFSLITYNCLQMNLAKTLENGFSTGHGFIREPNSIRSAASLACINLQSSQNDCYGGQSLSNWDGALAKYVRKSFVKTFKRELVNALKYSFARRDKEVAFAKKMIYNEESDIKNCFPSYLSMNAEKKASLFSYIHDYFKENAEKDDGQKIMTAIEQAHENACELVEDETMQAMEGAIHNFNTLHCLPATERIWIYDEKEKELKLMSMEELDNSFEKGRFKAISVNKTTGKAEFKYVLSSKKLQNNRRLVEIKTKTGQKVRVTDNHRMMYIKDNGEITEVTPESKEYQNSLSPRKIVFPEFSPKKYKILDYSKRGCVYKNNKLSIETIEMNEDLAEILGYYVADGSTKKKDDSYITFSTCEKVNGEYLKSLVRGYFGENVEYKETTYVREKDGMTVTKSHIFYLGVAVSRIFREMCGENALNKRVPNDIMMAPNSVIRRFLNTYLSCDGRRSSYNEFSTVSKTLRNQINLLIMRLGELPSYSEGMSSGNIISTNTLYTGRLGNFASKRAGIEVLGSDTSFEILRYNSAPITKRLKELKIPWGDAEEGRVPRRPSKEIRIHEVQNIVEKNKLKGFDTVINTYSIPIVSKEQSNSGEEYVYDISVEDNESFLTEEGIYVHNSRAGAQVPFSSILFGMDTSPEGRLVTKMTLQAIYNGLGHGETAIFPIAIFQLRSGINYNPGDPNYDLFQFACKVSAKRLFPNFLSLNASFNAPYYKKDDPDSYVCAMGCRTKVMANVNGPSESSGRGNFAFTTINLPYLALLADKKIDKFFNLLDYYMDLSKRYLEYRFEIIAKKKVKNFPFVMGQKLYMGSENLGPEDEIRPALMNASISIGFCGLAECLVALVGKHHGESDEAQELGLKIIGHMRDMTEMYKKQTHMNWSTFSTPAEATAGAFLRACRKEFGIIDGITNHEFFSNSFHVPVYYPTTIKHKVDIEAPYHALCDAGAISYVELDGDPSKNVEAFEKVIRYMVDKDMGYISINHPVDRDPVCGYTGIIQNECPHCHRREDGQYKVKIKRMR